MAVRYYGVAVGGQDAAAVLIQGSTTSRAIELAVNDASLPVGSVNKKKFIVEALEAILQAVQQDNP